MGAGVPKAVRQRALRKAQKECDQILEYYGIHIIPEIIIASNTECALVYRYTRNGERKTALSIDAILRVLKVD